AQFLSQKLGGPHASPEQLTNIPPHIIRLIPEEIVRKYRVVPVALNNRKLSLAMADPSDFAAIDEISFRTGYIVMPLITPELRLVGAMEKYYNIKRELRYIPVAGGSRGNRTARAEAAATPSAPPAAPKAAAARPAPSEPDEDILDLPELEEFGSFGDFDELADFGASDELLQTLTQPLPQQVTPAPSAAQPQPAAPPVTAAAAPPAQVAGPAGFPPAQAPAQPAVQAAAPAASAPGSFADAGRPPEPLRDFSLDG